tara:strand:+ start:524 stop:754 length:231 start_codon:yes stop_codon:yes gene_type:complete
MNVQYGSLTLLSGIRNVERQKDKYSEYKSFSTTNLCRAGRRELKREMLKYGKKIGATREDILNSVEDEIERDSKLK